MSNLITLTPALPPQLLSPQNMAINQPDTIILNWDHVDTHIYYNLQIAWDSEFSDIVLEEPALADSFYLLTGLLGQETYYWRVNTSNAGGTGDYSDSFSFSTGFPATPFLATPEDGTTDLPLQISLNWYRADSAKTYQLQLNRLETFSSRLMVLDTIVEDTTCSVEGLQSASDYYWRVAANNEYGTSTWSESYTFLTLDISSIEEEPTQPIAYELRQNYPNPFNPLTTIEYSIAEPGYVSLMVYDILGRTVVSLVSKEQPAGNYKVLFDASDFPS
jgi:hypothetical protein